MRSKETFEQLRNKKVGWFNLNMRLTLVVGAIVLFSIITSGLLSWLLKLLFPIVKKIPLIIQIGAFSFVFAMITVRIVSNLFFDPIRDLREGMQRVADGDFSAYLKTESTSAEIKEVVAGFNMMTNELRATEILQSDFVSNVSHEFKTPINAIEGYTTLLQDCEGLDDDHKEYIEKILFNTKRLSSLVGNILLLSKIENQSIETNKKKFRLDEQIRQSILALEPAWSAKDIEFDVVLDAIDFVGNEAIMHHVWDNLIGNAIKFSPVSGVVRITLKCSDDVIVFTVDDCGPGISENTKKHIFDKFFQEDSSHKSEGNGLGLALVKRILDISNGTVEAANLNGGGCRFIVRLKSKQLQQ